MASALLASRNEPCWGESKVYMRKNPNSNPRPDPVAALIQNSFGHDASRTALFRPMEVDDVPAAAAASATVSDNASSFNRKSSYLNHRRDLGEGCSGQIAFNISAYSKRELRELKRRLLSELDHVRGVISRAEACETARSARAGVNCGSSQPLDSLKPRSAELPSKKAKTLMVAASPRAPKRSVASMEMGTLLKALMIKCGQILSKLMKHKKSVWFNSPVDVVGMGLHDYHQIVKNPMDLGTVKSRLNKGLYRSPEEFAADVRLTFNNALLYNPQGHEVHKLADHLLMQFEAQFVPDLEKYEKQCRTLETEEDELHNLPSSSQAPLPGLDSKPDLPSFPKVQSVVRPLPAVQPQPSVPRVQPSSKSQPQTPVQLQQHFPFVARTSTGKLPKPKAKDVNKRPMSFDEKQKLGMELENLPHEKILQAVQIIKKRKMEAMQKGDDEIELDMEVLDTETLWELDRFLCNFKKTLSKMRRQEALASELNSDSQVEPSRLVLAEDVTKSTMLEDAPEAAPAKKIKKVDPVEEDVDIGDEMPATYYPSVEIEKDAACASSSSSSDSDSSSSSDSDSDSSSGSDSDEDEARSPG